MKTYYCEYHIRLSGISSRQAVSRLPLALNSSCATIDPNTYCNSQSVLLSPINLYPKKACFLCQGRSPCYVSILILNIRFGREIGILGNLGACRSRLQQSLGKAAGDDRGQDVKSSCPPNPEKSNAHLRHARK